MGLTTEILANWAPIFRDVRLQSADHGRFEVSLDGEPVFSKASLGRHARKGEIAGIFEAKLGPPLRWRKDA